MIFPELRSALHLPLFRRPCIRVLFGVLSIAFFSLCSRKPDLPESFPDLRKVVCLKSIEGCPCETQEGPFRVFHAESAEASGPPVDGKQKIRVRKVECVYPEENLVKMEYARVLSAPEQSRDHAPMGLAKFVENSALLEHAQKQDIGYFWETFYHLALESMYPGLTVDIHDPHGNVLGKASDKFLREVTWEGSGISLTGLHLQYAGPGLYTTYPANIWGYGAGRFYQILPYRTIAVNFDGFCEKLASKFPGCSKDDILGLMLFIPSIAEKKIKMQDGTFHDGYFCATDTGDPYYIRPDRIDMFVGAHGGGNPFLPPPRRMNDFIAGGVDPLLPSDWRYWNTVKDRAWCPPDRIPADPFRPSEEDCTHDYHVVAREKALRIFALFDSQGRPIRCKKNPL